MTANDLPDRAELTDDKLDRLLRYVDDELLHHIQATVDPAITLTAVMNIGAANVEQARPGEPAHADQAAVLIMRRRDLIQISRTLDRALDLAHGLARGLARVRDLTGGRDFPDGVGALALALDLDRIRFRQLVSDLDHALASDLDHALASDLAAALDRADALDYALGYALAGDLGRAFTRALARALARAGAHDRARNLALDLAHDLDQALDRARTLAEQEIIAAGADLSLLAIDDVEMVAGVIWDETTAWPPGIADRVRAASHEIRPGVYRVRRGSERDPAEYAR